jgi:aryl carrier-like protein
MSTEANLTSGEWASPQVLVDPVTTGRVRQYLSEELPSYMVPSIVVLLDALPLTASRKIDVAALPDLPDGAYQAPRAVVAAPADEREETMAAIWREVLGRDDLSVHDNFFQLGGNSLAVMKVLARLWRRHRVRITVQAFFEQPTIRGLARQVKVGPDAG